MIQNICQQRTYKINGKYKRKIGESISSDPSNYKNGNKIILINCSGKLPYSESVKAERQEKEIICPFQQIIIITQKFSRKFKINLVVKNF